MSAEGVRVGLVITALGCGGAERQISHLANFLAGRGHRVGMFVLHGGQVFYPLAPAVEVFLAPSQGLSRAGRGARRLTWLRRELSSFGPQVVVSFIEVANVFALLAAPRRVPVVVSERSDPRWHRPPALYRWLRRWVYRRAARLVVQAESYRPWAQGLVPGERVVVLPNPVLPAPAAPPGGPGRLVGVGRLAWEKGFDLLLDVCGRLLPRHPPWSAVIFGEGPARAHLEAQRARLGLGDRVSLPGQVVDPASLLRREDIFVLPSRYEGFPNALAEAMARGVAAVAFDCPSGPRELIRHGVDGWLVPAGDTVALEQALARLMTNPAERQRLAARAPEVTARFPAGELLGRWEELCLELAAGGPAR